MSGGIQWPDESLQKMWRMTDWETAETELRQLQRDIARAAMRGERNNLVEAQKRLVNSIEARLLAVRHVCDKAAQPGVDGVKWKTDAEKMRAAWSLGSKGYMAQPMRMVIVRPKGQTKSRNVQIPTFFDRAMQVLYAYSLDPVAESTGDRKSFAFRKGRSQLDVHAFIERAFDSDDIPRFLVKADVKACYASISHEWLLDNIPMDPYVLRQFLKTGFVFGGELFPPDDFGISIGTTISPILANMALDGAQAAIFEGLHGRVKDVDYVDGNLIRFADDILVTARTRESAEKILDIIGKFIAVRGLRFSEEKTGIIDVSDGFDFLSHHYWLSDGHLYSSPSKAAVAKMENTIRELILSYRGGQKALIDKINKKLVGWAGYHKMTKAEPAFRHMDSVVKTLLLELSETLNPKLSRAKIISKYFYQEPDGEYVYALENKPDVRVHRLAKTILVAHQPVSTRKHPYLDDEYYEDRTDERAIMAVTGKYKPIWARQGGRCYYCNKPILTDERKGLVTIDPTRMSGPKNLAYVHEYCMAGQAEFYDVGSDIDSRFDLHELLTQMADGKKSKTAAALRKSKFHKLTEHFRFCKEPVFTMTYDEIGKIIGGALCDSAHKFLDYWYRHGEKKISYAWLSNGYKIRTLYLDKKRVVFERADDKSESLEIPDVFLLKRLPHDAKVETEQMFEYIKKKYGL